MSRRRTAIPDSYRGPHPDAYLDPCPCCDGEGTVEDGEQVDVDDFMPGLCPECEGDGRAVSESEGDDDEEE